MSPIRVFLVDAQEVSREGLSRLIEERSGYQVVGTSEGGIVGIEKICETKPDIVITDTNIVVGFTSYDIQLASKQIGTISPNTRVIIFTNSVDDRSMFVALRLGARAYLNKDTQVDNFIDTISRVHQGEVIVSAPMATTLLREFSKVEDQRLHGTKHTFGLSKREKEALELLTEGKTNKEIADILVIHTNTVKSHLSSIMQKLEVHNRQQAASKAMKLGIVKDVRIQQ